MAGQFCTDAEVLEALKKPFGLAYSACSLGISLERARTVLAAHKIEILKSRIEEHKQTIPQIAFHLELIQHIDSLKTWFTKHYGDTR